MPKHTIRAAAPGLILALAVLLAAVLALASYPVHAAASTGKCDGHTVVYEDDPCWNWTADGNGYRGVVTMWGTPLVVSARRYCLLAKHHNLDPHNPRLRGDAWARRNAC